MSLPSYEIYYLPCVTLPGLTSLFDRGILGFHLPLSWLLTLIILVFRLETDGNNDFQCSLVICHFEHRELLAFVIAY